MKALIKPLVIAMALGLAAPSFAADDAESKCLKCHKRNGTMAGVHATVGKNGVSCIRCHGEQGKHPRDKQALTRFGAESPTPLDLQQKPCRRCHSSSKLQKADWTHDVHRTQVACAACHQLHPQQDSMQALSPAARSVMCANCHSQHSQEAQP